MSQSAHEKFIRLRAIEGKSLADVAQLLNMDMDTAVQTEQDLQYEMRQAKADAYDAILEQKQINSTERFRYLCDVYNRLKAEFNNRDFTGLPTDKLYHIMDDVYTLITQLREEQNSIED